MPRSTARSRRRVFEHNSPSQGTAFPAIEIGRAKSVAGNQKAVDDLPFDSGTWRVEGVPGLYLRCRRQSKTFFIQRRVNKELVKETLGQLTIKQAKEKAMKTWNAMKPKPTGTDVVTLAWAIESYIEEKHLAPKSISLLRYNTERYLVGELPYVVVKRALETATAAG